MNWRTPGRVHPTIQFGILVSFLTQAYASPPPDRPTTLSKEVAVTRSKQISKITYGLWFDLNAESEEFRGRTVVHFNLKPKAKDQSHQIFLDLEGGSIQSIQVNGIAVENLKDPERFDGHHIYFKIKELQASANKIEIAYTHPYSTDGNGLHRFKDPVDNQVYLYSNFEPYEAHRMFPCFDQPDLKATYQLAVDAPPHWQVISSTLPPEPQLAEGQKHWKFPTSAVFSTYVFSLHAGPYSVWKSDANGIPIRLFSRKSLAKYVDHDEWLKTTANGLDFFDIEFGYLYPFAKYDQIIVPDFNAGAMENVGAVTFSERFVYRTRVTQDRKRQRAETILHEMAHMWFGNLVTMRWWNGLWLNESFATFLATWATEKATQFQGSWQAFFASIKQWAYWEDQLVTTHPIELPVANTDQAEANFDGITYGKGASVLKQLAFYLGEDEFREGLQRYFIKFDYRNTSLSDFFKMLAEASSSELNSWQQSWLLTTGVNTISPQWECEIDPKNGKSKITKFEITQTGSPNRSHRTQVGLFYFPKGRNRNSAPLSAEKPIEATYSTASTSVMEAIRKPCPDFVFPNFQDYDYVKVQLDPVSQMIALKHLSQISDPLTRQMIWHTLWEMVIDGSLKPQDYAETVLKHLPQEKSSLVLSKVLQTLVSSSANRSSVLKFLEGDLRDKYRQKFEYFVKLHWLRAPASSDLQLIWYQAFLEVAKSTHMTQFAKKMVEGKQKIKGFDVDQERRWELLLVLARNGIKGTQELIATELKKDPTDIGTRYSISAEALTPDAALKSKWLSQIFRMPLAPTPAVGAVLPLAKVREAMTHYHNLNQEEFTRNMVDVFFEKLPQIAASASIEDQEYAKWISKAMFPSLCDPLVVAKTSSLLESHLDLPASVSKSLKVGRQEEERCIRARAKSKEK